MDEPESAWRVYLAVQFGVTTALIEPQPSHMKRRSSRCSERAFHQRSEKRTDRFSN